MSVIKKKLIADSKPEFSKQNLKALEDMVDLMGITEISKVDKLDSDLVKTLKVSPSIKKGIAMALNTLEKNINFKNGKGSKYLLASLILSM